MKISDIDTVNPDDINTTKDTIVFYVSSTIYPSHDTIFTPSERLGQTVETMKSIKTAIPDAIIIMTELSHLEDDDIKLLSPYVDNLLLFESKGALSMSKSQGEVYMSMLLCYILGRCVFKKMYKLSGRYYLTEQFNDADFLDDKITLRRSTWQPERLCMVTVLYCVPYCQLNNYGTALIKAGIMLNKNQMDIEHALFQSLPEDSYIEIPVVNVWGLFGPEKITYKC